METDLTIFCCGSVCGCFLPGAPIIISMEFCLFCLILREKKNRNFSNRGTEEKKIFHPGKKIRAPFWVFFVPRRVSGVDSLFIFRATWGLSSPLESRGKGPCTPGSKQRLEHHLKKLGKKTVEPLFKSGPFFFFRETHSRSEISQNIPTYLQKCSVLFSRLWKKKREFSSGKTRRFVPSKMFFFFSLMEKNRGSHCSRLPLCSKGLTHFFQTPNSSVSPSCQDKVSQKFFDFVKSLETCLGTKKINPKWFEGINATKKILYCR